MKLVSYKRKTARELQPWRAGLLVGDGILDIQEQIADAPATMQGYLDDWDNWLPKLAQLTSNASIQLNDVLLGAPLPRPPSFRDFYAFEEHVKTARAQRGLEVMPEWYRIPVFYFSNSAAFIGPDAPVVRPASTVRLDYELEIACVIGRPGVNISVEEADQHIAGFTILNDWSARDIQREEMKVGLGPAKGKDFATSFGPYLVTPDELDARRIPGERGNRYDLTMVARVNGKEYSRGYFSSIYYTFAEMIARASADCPLYPGDVIGSGTVGTGCILELGEGYNWLQPGDIVELEVEGLGILRNVVA